MKHDMSVIVPEIEALIAAYKRVADQETSISDRDWYIAREFMKLRGRHHPSSPTDLIACSEAQTIFKDAPISDKCDCPCHSEGLWKLPDEVERLKKDIEVYLDRLTLIISKCSPEMQQLYQSMGWVDLGEGTAKRIEDE